MAMWPCGPMAVCRCGYVSGLCDCERVCVSGAVVCRSNKSDSYAEKSQRGEVSIALSVRATRCSVLTDSWCYYQLRMMFLCKVPAPLSAYPPATERVVLSARMLVRQVAQGRSLVTDRPVGTRAAMLCYYLLADTTGC